MHSSGPKDHPFRLTSLPRWFYRHSLSFAFAALLLIALTVRAVSGTTGYAAKRSLEGPPPRSFGAYLPSAEFW